ncbi:17651_t:CDS:2 [Dentiscutata erythropus]|uniref:17651_t:CDS:1 n=1 Tax=Dentiscutata erythropus TaxID=1348616 RepID=A0A9N8VZ29_9GLOM|nr:17651_t:CDS:2 [Dentiscutata erythropus]
MILYEHFMEINRNILEYVTEVNKMKEEIQRADLADKELRNKPYIPYQELKDDTIETTQRNSLKYTSRVTDTIVNIINGQLM